MEEYITMASTALLRLTDVMELGDLQHGCSMPCPNAQIASTSSSTFRARVWTARLRMALSQTFGASDILADLLGTVRSCVIDNSDLGLLLLQQLLRSLEDDVPAAAGFATWAGSGDCRPPVGPTAADLPLVASVCSACPDECGLAALDTVVAVVMHTSPKQLSSWFTDYNTCGLTWVTEWLLEAALGWLSTPLLPDAAESDDAAGAGSLDGAGCAAFLRRHHGSGSGTSNGGQQQQQQPGFQLCSRMRCGAVLVAALAWSCPRLSRWALAAVLERLREVEQDMGAKRKDEDVEMVTVTAEEAVALWAGEAMAFNHSGSSGATASGRGDTAFWRGANPMWFVLQAIVSDIVQVQGVGHRLKLLQLSESEHDATANGGGWQDQQEPYVGEDIQLVSQLCGDDVGAYEHMLIQSFKLLSLLQEHAAFTTHMGPIAAVRFVRLVAPLLPYDENLLEVLLLHAVSIACDAADAAKAENAAAEAAARSPSRAVATVEDDVPSVHGPVFVATAPYQSFCNMDAGVSFLSTPSWGGGACSSMVMEGFSRFTLAGMAATTKSTNMTGSVLPSAVALSLEVLCCTIECCPRLPPTITPLVVNLLNALLRLVCKPLELRVRSQVQNLSFESISAAGMSMRILMRMLAALIAAAAMNVNGTGPRAADGGSSASDEADPSILCIAALATAMRCCLRDDADVRPSSPVSLADLPAVADSAEPFTAHEADSITPRPSLQWPPLPPRYRLRLSDCLRWHGPSITHGSAGGVNPTSGPSAGPSSLHAGVTRTSLNAVQGSEVEAVLVAPPLPALITGLGKALAVISHVDHGHAVESSARMGKSKAAHLRSQLPRPTGLSSHDQVKKAVSLMAEGLVLVVLGDPVAEHGGDGTEAPCAAATPWCGRKCSLQQQQQDALTGVAADTMKAGAATLTGAAADTVKAGAVQHLRVQVIAAFIGFFAEAPEAVSLAVLRAAAPLLSCASEQQLQQEPKFSITRSSASLPCPAAVTAIDQVLASLHMPCGVTTLPADTETSRSEVRTAQDAMCAAVQLACKLHPEDIMAGASQKCLSPRQQLYSDGGGEMGCTVLGAQDEDISASSRHRALSVVMAALMACHHAMRREQSMVAAAPLQALVQPQRCGEQAALSGLAAQGAAVPADAGTAGIAEVESAPGRSREPVTLPTANLCTSDSGINRLTNDAKGGSSVNFGAGGRANDADGIQGSSCCGTKGSKGVDTSFFTLRWHQPQQPAFLMAPQAGEGTWGKFTVSNSTPQPQVPLLQATPKTTAPFTSSEATQRGDTSERLLPQLMMNTWPVSLEASTVLLKRFLGLAPEASLPLLPAACIQHCSLTSYAVDLVCNAMIWSVAAATSRHNGAELLAKQLATVGDVAVDVVLMARTMLDVACVGNRHHISVNAAVGGAARSAGAGLGVVKELGDRSRRMTSGGDASPSRGDEMMSGGSSVPVPGKPKAKVSRMLLELQASLQKFNEFPDAGADITESTRRSRCTSIISGADAVNVVGFGGEVSAAAGHALAAGLRLLVRVAHTAAVDLSATTPQSSQELNSDGGSRLAAACSMLLLATANRRGGGSSEGRGGGDRDPQAMSCHLLLQPLMKRLYPPSSVVEGLVREALLSARPHMHINPKLMLQEQPLQAAQLCLLVEARLLLLPALTHAVSPHEKTQGLRRRHQKEHATREAAVGGMATRMWQLHSTEGSHVVEGLASLAAALPCGKGIVAEAATSICHQMLVHMDSDADPSGAVAAAGVASRSPRAVINGPAAWALVRLTCQVACAWEMLELAATLLVFLAHHASSGSSDGGGSSRSLLERRVVGQGDAQACTKRQQQLRQRWRICPYILRAVSAGAFNAPVPPQNALRTLQGRGGGRNGGGRGNGRPARGTEAMYSTVPSWLAGSSTMQTAQLLLEIAASTLPLVISAANDVAAASNEVEVTANGGGSASSRKNVKVHGLPSAVATALGCCLHAADMLLLPMRVSHSEVTAAAVVSGGASTPSVQRPVLDGTANIIGLITPVGGLCRSATVVTPVTGGATAVAGQWPVLVHTAQEGLSLTEAEEEQERWRLLEMVARHLKAVAQCGLACTLLLRRRAKASAAVVASSSDAAARNRQPGEPHTLPPASTTTTASTTCDGGDACSELCTVLSLWNYHSKDVESLIDQLLQSHRRSLQHHTRGLGRAAVALKAAWLGLVRLLEDALTLPKPQPPESPLDALSSPRSAAAATTPAHPRSRGALLSLARALHQAQGRVWRSNKGGGHSAAAHCLHFLPSSPALPVSLSQLRPHSSYTHEGGAAAGERSPQEYVASGFPGDGPGFAAGTSTAGLAAAAAPGADSAAAMYADEPIPYEPLFVLLGHLSDDDEDQEEENGKPGGGKGKGPTAAGTGQEPWAPLAALPRDQNQLRQLPSHLQHEQQPCGKPLLAVAGKERAAAQPETAATQGVAPLAVTRGGGLASSLPAADAVTTCIRPCAVVKRRRVSPTVVQAVANVAAASGQLIAQQADSGVGLSKRTKTPCTAPLPHQHPTISPMAPRGRAKGSGSSQTGAPLGQAQKVAKVLRAGGGDSEGADAVAPAVGAKQPRGRSGKASVVPMEAPEVHADNRSAVPSRGHRRKGTKRRATTNPFVAACLRETMDRDSGSDGDWSELEDFIVCQPERDYEDLLRKKYYYGADELCEEN